MKGKKKYLLHCIIICSTWLSMAASLLAQPDSLKQLPIIEVSSLRANNFTIGQVKIGANESLNALLQQQALQNWIQYATPLSFRTYGTGTASVSARGTGANHTALLWNGINIQNPLNGIIDLPITAVGSNDKVEVKLGAGTALFGSGAIGATIFLENTPKSEDGIATQVNYGIGSFDYHQISASSSYRKKAFAGQTRIAQQGASNNFTYRNPTIIGSPLQDAQNAAFTHFNLTQHLYFNVAKNQFLKIHFWHSQNKRALTPTMTAANVNAVLRDTATRVATEWTGFFNQNIIKYRVAVAHDNNRYDSDIEKNSKNAITTFVNEAEWNRKVNKIYECRIAANVTIEQPQSNNFSKNTPQRQRIALLVNQLLHLKEKLDVSVNLRQEFLNQNLVPFTFSIGANYQIQQRWALRGAFSKVYNIPALNDLYWKNGLGNPNLLPENGFSGEIGTDYKYSNDVWRYKIQASLYHIYLKDRIQWLPQTDGIWRPSNIAQMRSSGLELMTEIERKISHFSILFRPQYQLAHSIDEQEKQLIYVPKHNVSLLLLLKFKKMQCIYQQTISSRRFMTADNTNALPAVSVANLSFDYRLLIKKYSFNITASILNVFNKDYQIIQYYPNPKRNYRLSITTNF